MDELQTAKQVVRDYYDALDTAQPGRIANATSAFVSEQYRWCGFHPFNELSGASDVAEVFWEPLRSALARTQRRMDVFMAGKNSVDGFQSVWVNSTGHLMGLFDRSWLGVPPTRRLSLLRYSEFHRVEGGKIIETAMYFDLPHFMAQAGCNPFASQTAANLVQPGPATHKGLMFGPQDPEEGARTRTAIGNMVKDLGSWQSGLPLTEELSRTWHDDMIWWGPTGIGSTYTIERYAEQHAGPFRASFADRTATSHVCSIAEGHFGGFFGWPNFSATLTGDIMGMEATQKRGEFRVIDIYRRDGAKLAENWVYIDLLHFWKQQGVDLLRAEIGKF